MLCQACHGLSRGRILCRQCASQLRRPPERVLPGGVRVIAAFEHSGPARKLAHQLKYRGLTGFADLVAATVAPSVPSLPLVPVPRARSRWLKYGIDPAAEITRRLSARLGVPTVNVLAAPVHSARRAGGNHRRPVSPYRLRESALESVVLVDDVVTTGATLAAAIDAIGYERVSAVVAANVVPAGPRPAKTPPPRAPESAERRGSV